MKLLACIAGGVMAATCFGCSAPEEEVTDQDLPLAPYTYQLPSLNEEFEKGLSDADEAVDFEGVTRDREKKSLTTLNVADDVPADDVAAQPEPAPVPEEVPVVVPDVQTVPQSEIVPQSTEASDAPVAQRSAVPVTTADQMAPGTISIEGIALTYIDDYNARTAPTKGAALWDGSDSTTDGAHGYFIGHNPGDFSCVMDLRHGSRIYVKDWNGSFRTYCVCDIFDVSTTQDFNQMLPYIQSFGECVVLQTCIPDHSLYRIVIAQ